MVSLCLSPWPEGAVQMIEIGNGVFTAEQSPQALAMAQTHMTCKCKDITEFGV